MSTNTQESKAATDARALRESIAHWERMRDDPLGCEDKTGATQCALCKLYLFEPGGDFFRRPSEKQCEGCPIRKATGLQWCNGTPYEEAAEAFWKMRALVEDGYCDPDELDTRPFAEKAQAMIEFMEGLLERLEGSHTARDERA